MYINRVIDNMFKAPVEWTIVTPIRRQWRGLHFLPLQYLKRPITISEQHNLPGINLTLRFVQTHAHARTHARTHDARTHTHTHTHTHRGLYHVSTIRQLLCPHHRWGRILFLVRILSACRRSLLSALYLQNERMDFGRTYTSLSLGGEKILIRFW